MNCPKGCITVVQQPIEMVELYVKNHPSRMNKNHVSDYSIVGYLCPQCKEPVIK